MPNAEKIVETRILHKYDTWANWQDVWTSFVPKKGELCIIEVPANTTIQGLPTHAGDVQRFIKIGNGTTTIGDLEWVTSPLVINNSNSSTTTSITANNPTFSTLTGLTLSTNDAGALSLNPQKTTFTLPSIGIGYVEGTTTRLKSNTTVQVVTNIEIEPNGHDIKFYTSDLTIPAETNLSKGTDTSDTAQTLSFGSTFTAMVDTSVNGHTITDKNRTFTLPARPTAVIQKTSVATGYRPIVLGTQMTSTPTIAFTQQDGDVFVAQNFAYNPTQKTLAMDNAMIGNKVHIQYQTTDKCLNFTFD